MPQVEENEDAEPVGEVSDPVGAFTALALQCGLIKEGASIDKKTMAFAWGVVDLCASIGDAYGSDSEGGNAGEHIRARYHSD
jgi:hypothetical protein